MNRDEGEVEITVGVRRCNQSSAAPCGGYWDVREIRENGTEVSGGYFDMVHRALGRIPEPGSRLRLTVQVEVLDEAVASRQKCHNPWPAHVHDGDRR